MKRILTAIAAIILFSATSYAQSNAKVDKNGNYVALVSTTKKEPTATGKTFTDGKGKTLPVYLSATGKLFVLRTSEKTGKEYKMYLKVEGK